MKIHLKPNRPVADILICTPDIKSFLFQQCLDSVLESISPDNVNIMAVHNGWDPGFSHAHEMNKMLEYAERPLITLDDDTIVQGDWFLRMMDVSLHPDTGVVATTVYRKNYGLWASGAIFGKDGQAVMYQKAITQPEFVPCAASCCWLFKKKNLRLDETTYQKYHFDSDFTLTNWEAHQPLIVVPATVYHVSGGQMKQKQKERLEMIKRDKAAFQEKWLDSGRYQKVIEENRNKWSPELKSLLEKTK